MRGSGRICYRVAVGILVLAFTACKCGEEKEKAKPAEPAGPEYQSTVSKLPGAQQADVAALIPQDAGLVMISDDLGRLLGWLEGRKWFQALKKTPFYDDLRFTGAWFRFSTLKHRLESVSAVRLGEARLEEMLKTPAGLALRPDGEGTEVLLVKQIDLRIQALDRLAEVFNQITPREGMLKSREVSGLNLRELAVDEQHRLYYLLFSNLLLISNSEKYLLQAADLARGESSGSIADDSEVAALLLDGRENFDLVACLDPDRLSAGKKEKGARLIESVERLLLKFKTGSPPRLEITGVLDKQRAGEELNAPFKAGNIVPLDSRMLLGLARVDLAAAWKRAVSRVEAKKKLPAMVKQEVSGKLLPAVRNEVLLLLGGVDAAGKRPVPHAGILVRIDKEKAPEVLEAAGKLFSYLLGEEVKQRVLRQMSDHAIFVPSGDQAFSPSFSVVGDWLVACTSEQMLRKIVATSLGQEPGIADLPGFTEKVAGARPYFFLSYLDCGVFSEDLKNYFRSVTGLGDRFDPAAVEETVAPLLDALGKAGRIGGAVIQRGAGVTGSVVPL